tara:strand:- start:31921 stop:32040 length:120 start_codon:yes stop_codon:yes gene_type:complete
MYMPVIQTITADGYVMKKYNLRSITLNTSEVSGDISGSE